jgi:hypothetical protein
VIAADVSPAGPFPSGSLPAGKSIDFSVDALVSALAIGFSPNLTPQPGDVPTACAAAIRSPASMGQPAKFVAVSTTCCPLDDSRRMNTSCPALALWNRNAASGSIGMRGVSTAGSPSSTFFSLAKEHLSTQTSVDSSAWLVSWELATPQPQADPSARRRKFWTLAPLGAVIAIGVVGAVTCCVYAVGMGLWIMSGAKVA